MTMLNDEKKNNNTDAIASNFCFHNKFRYFILLLSSLALTLVTGNSVALNFTIICMNKEGKDDQSLLNLNSSEIIDQG
uniref:Uncharacterized protein n=1 Tax=Ditylenchus dipsaci TaxID=166011 RepID=A0A915E9M9_9BILA